MSRTGSFFTASAGIALLTIGTALASEEPLETIEVDQAATRNAPSHPMLEEIIVTAQKRSESLQRTPISIEAFNADALEQRGISGIDDLLANVPNLSIEVFPTHNATLRIYIRGIGVHDAQLTQDPAVGIYIDGVYIARSVGLSLDVADLERIEVLRGPQGTLYGRNTTGGAINLITRRPDPQAFSADYGLTVGSRNQLLGKAALNVPLASDLAVRLAVLASQRDGFVDNTGPGADFADRRELALRLDTRWLASDSLSLDYAAEFTDMDYVNSFFQSVLLPETDKGTGELIKPFGVARTRYSDQRLEAISSSAPMEWSGSRIAGQALTLSKTLGDSELKYIGAYRRLVDRQYAELGGGRGSTQYRIDTHAYDGPAAFEAQGAPTPLVIPTVTQAQWSHEFQLSGSALGDSLRYVTGIYAFREWGIEDRHKLNHQFSSGIAPEQINQFGLGDLIAQTNNGRIVQLVDFWWRIDNTALAAYGQTSWTPEVLDRRLNLTLGYRHSRDERRAVKFRITDSYIESVDDQGNGSATLLSSADMFDFEPAAREFSDDSFSLIGAFDVGDDMNVYAKAVQAYKSGGFNVRDPHRNAESEANDTAAYGFGFAEGFDAEHVISWELGMKSEWLGRRLRINADLFLSDYTDMQINFLIPGTIFDTKTRNAGKARLAGLELDGSWAIAPGLTLMADYAYLDAQVQEVIDQDGNNVAHLFPFPSAPPHSGVLALDISTPLARLGAALRAHLSWNWIGERIGVVITEDRRGLNSIPAYGLLNARFSLVGLRAGDGAMDIALWGRNLADKVYPIIAIDNVPHSDRAVVWGDPRSIGVDISYRFN